MTVDREYARVLQTTVDDVNNRILGIAVGVIAGLTIFSATIWLVVKGGDVVGPHLSLLAQFFPGYSVTYVGSVVGLFYGFVVGYFGGWSVAWLYNRFVTLRNR